jgi:hypothetical protein
MTIGEALQAALGVEHQVVYGYGLAAAHLTKTRYTLALTALAEAETRRDLLADLIRRLGQVPSPAAPAYLPPTAVTDAATAVALCLRLEQAAEGAAWDLVAASAPGDDVRRLGVHWLGVAAVNAAKWAGNASTEPALPGQPQ